MGSYSGFLSSYCSHASILRMSSLTMSLQYPPCTLCREVLEKVQAKLSNPLLRQAAPFEF